MADELQYSGFLSDIGLTVTARVYDDTGTQLGGDVSCPVTGLPSYYSGDMPSIAADDYLVLFFNGSGGLLGQTTIYWDGSAEIELRSMDTKLDTIVTGIATITTDVAAVATDVWAFVLENGRTAQGFMRIILSSAAGVLKGAATTEITIRDDADSKDRITATVDPDGNRAAVALDDG